VSEPAQAAEKTGIPIENLWFLLVFASGLAQFSDRFDGEVRGSPDLPSLLARLLLFVVSRRLRRNLSRAYEPRSAVLRRVRGRIDALGTYSHLYLEQGRVACRFEDLTVDTARNRLVRAALAKVATEVADADLAHRCRNLAGFLSELGVNGRRPTRAERARDQIARHETEDRLMVAVADLALDLRLPSEAAGDEMMTALARDEQMLRLLFEKFVAGLYRYELGRRGGAWRITEQKWLYWPSSDPTPGMMALLPQMQADLILDDMSSDRRIILDTKFTGMLRKRRFGGSDSLKSEHLYQLYAYLRTQAEVGDGRAAKAEGVLLYPSLGVDVDEAVTMQGHRLRFASVNLARDAEDITARLLHLVEHPASPITATYALTT
jgi:5-methylcytosine-specific restriction enzyme subunit McrC